MGKGKHLHVVPLVVWQSSYTVTWTMISTPMIFGPVGQLGVMYGGGENVLGGFGYCQWFWMKKDVGGVVE